MTSQRDAYITWKKRMDRERKQYFDLLKQGTVTWNKWRDENPDIEEIDLSYLDLTRLGIDLRGINLNRTMLDGNFFLADLSGANLSWSGLIGSDFREANLTGANLTGANLTAANLSNAVLNGATLDSCWIYAISAWDIIIDEKTIQTDLIITQFDEEPIITVDNLEIAQFINLLLNNSKIRDVIDTITSKVVLILGSFTLKRKDILDSIKEELRSRNYTPVLFDFKKPTSRDLTETISTLAHMARFVIADITDAKSIPQELQIIVPNLPSVPIVPLIVSSQHEYGMFEHFKRFPWVLPVYQYVDERSLLHSLKERIIDPAEQKAQELAQH